MRNGVIADISELLQFPYLESATKKEKKFQVWKGECECCHSPMTWNINGTYSAYGIHQFDIVKKVI